MNTRWISIALITAAIAAPNAFAQAPAKQDRKAMPMASDADMDKYYAAMQERHKKMQDQMERLSQTKDPKARQKILEEHWKTMHEGMDMMMGRNGMGPGMMMGGMGHHRGMGPGGQAGRMSPGSGMGPGAGMSGPAAKDGQMAMSPDMMNQRQRRLEQRMDMMQMMMDQMMQRQGMTGPGPMGGPPSAK